MSEKWTENANCEQPYYRTSFGGYTYTNRAGASHALLVSLMSDDVRVPAIQQIGMEG